MGHTNGNNGSGEVEFPDGSKGQFDFSQWEPEPNLVPLDHFKSIHPVPPTVFTVSGTMFTGGAGGSIDELLDRRLLSAWVSVATGLLRVFNWDERHFRAEPFWACLN